MKKEELRRALKAEPFRSFTIRTVSGEEYRVDHPEIVALAQEAADRTIAVYSTADHALAIVDLPLTESIRFGRKRNGQARRRRKSA